MDRSHKEAEEVGDTMVDTKVGEEEEEAYLEVERNQEILWTSKPGGRS